MYKSFKYACLLSLAVSLGSGLVGILLLKEGTTAYSTLKIVCNVTLWTPLFACIFALLLGPMVRIARGIRYGIEEAEWRIRQWEQRGPCRKWGTPLIFIGIVSALIMGGGETEPDVSLWWNIIGFASGMAVAALGWLINYVPPLFGRRCRSRSKNC